MVKGLLALQYPLAYASVFEPLTDFEVWDMSLIADPDMCEPNFEKEFWADCSGLERADYYGDRTILPTVDDPDKNILSCAKETQVVSGKVGLWRGEKHHLKLLEQCCDIVALPWYQYRRLHYVDPGTSHKYHLYGFSNLDELRRFPVRSLSTSVPITAAVNGIDLRTRERRPQRLFPFSYNMKMSDKQIELAVQNVLAIKEALQSHDRPNRVSHT